MSGAPGTGAPVAELEVYHSRPIAPTRRVALGHRRLPVGGDPGAGTVLLGAVVARHMRAVDPDDWTDLIRLTHQVERGYRIAQPRLRHRLQRDRVGLTRSRHRAFACGSGLVFDHDDGKGRPVQQVLGAVYAVADLDLEARRSVMAVIRRGMRWIGPAGDTDGLVGFLAGHHRGLSLPDGAVGDPTRWALGVLGFVANGGGDRSGHGGEAVGDGAGRAIGDGVAAAVDTPERAEVMARFRALVRDAHPDQGGAHTEAAARIAELREARRILLR